MHPKISFVIPAYNVGKYLEECLDSCLNQLTCVEVVCVNDGSTDNSGDIIKSYAQRFANIKELHQPNCGVSVARNNGIKNASGDYIMFLDGDDFIRPESVHIITEYMDKSGDDVVFFDYIRINENVTAAKAADYPVSDSIQTEKYYNRDSFRKFPGKADYGLSTRYMYRRAYIAAHNLEFIPGMIMAEDRSFLYFALMHITEMTHIKLPLYFYRQNTQSVVHTYLASKRRDYVDGKIKAAVYYRSYPKSKTLPEEIRHEIGEMCIGHTRGSIALAIDTGDMNYCRETLNKLTELGLYPYHTCASDVLKGRDDISRIYAAYSVLFPFRTYVYTCCFLRNMLNKLCGK
jgi:glycosyltransferase involved in cell wall biosynthesis